MNLHKIIKSILLFLATINLLWSLLLINYIGLILLIPQAFTLYKLYKEDPWINYLLILSTMTATILFTIYTLTEFNYIPFNKETNQYALLNTALLLLLFYGVSSFPLYLTGAIITWVLNLNVTIIQPITNSITVGVIIIITQIIIISMLINYHTSLIKHNQKQTRKR